MANPNREDLTQAVEATKAIVALLDCEMRGTPLTPDQARVIGWVLQQQSKAIENQGREIEDEKAALRAFAKEAARQLASQTVALRRIAGLPKYASAGVPAGSLSEAQLIARRSLQSLQEGATK